MEGGEHAAYIVIHGPGHNGTKLALREGITSFGRLPSNDVILLGDLVSRHHSRITFFEGRATLQDLGSNNGSWVNQDRVTTHVLKGGDVARVGNFQLAFHVGSLPRSPAKDHPTAPELDALPGPTSAPATQGFEPSRSVLLQEFQQAREGAGNRSLQILYHAAEALARTEDAHTYLLEILDLTMDQVGAELAVFVKRDDEGVFRVQAALGPDGPTDEASPSTSVINWVTQKNFPVKADNIHNDLRFSDQSRVAHPMVISAPLSTEEGEVLGALYMARSNEPFHESELDILAAIGHLAVKGVLRDRRRSAMDGGTIGRFFAPAVADQLVKKAGGQELPMNGRNGAVLVCDLPELMRVGARTNPAQLTKLLDAYLDRVADVSARSKGTIVCVLGAQVVMTFGLVQTRDDASSAALLAALELRASIDQLARRVAGLKGLRVRIGTSSGWMTYGPVGTRSRLSFTVLGSPMLGAMELSKRAKRGQILSAETTAREAQHAITTRPVGQDEGIGPIFEVVARAE